MHARKHLSPLAPGTFQRGQGDHFTRGAVSLALLILSFAVSVPQAEAVTSRVIHHFNNQQGTGPEGVVIGPDGNLYGVTLNGSSNNTGGGTVFELTQSTSGHWLETKEFNIINIAAYPNGHLIFDSAGNLYGTTQQGLGGYTVCGCCICGFLGTAFELSPATGGPGWHGTILANFNDPGLGGVPMFPTTGLVRDSAGNLHGAAAGLNGNLAGEVYELTPAADGTWTTVLGPSGEGYVGPNLTLDAAGNLYGTTGATNGGATGSVFKIDTNQKVTTLYSFTGGADGGDPEDQSNLIFDAAGNLYGTTRSGGAFGKGTVFELSPNTDGSWTEKVIYSFNDQGTGPTAGLVADTAGNLYGEAYQGGDGGAGVVFKLTPAKNGHWKYTPLRSFHGPDGSGPSYGLVMDGAGNLYGTTWTGGTYGNGTVFEITP